jgi:hypothetical protein
MAFKLSILIVLGISVYARGAILLTAGIFEGATTQSWSDEHIRVDASGRIISRYRASFQADQNGLHAVADVFNDIWDPHPPRFAGIRVDDVVVNPVPIAFPAPGDPPPTTTTVRFGGNLSGHLTAGDMAGANASAVLNMSIAGKTTTSIIFGLDELPVSGFFQTSEVTVIVGQPFTVSASLRVKVAARGHATIDFGDSFTFDPSSVLVLEPGFTASSPSWGLVDNRLSMPAVAGVPEPSGCAFVLLAGVIVWTITKR